MVQRISRVRNLLVNDATVTAEVAAGSIMADSFAFGQAWPLPGILLEGIGGLADSVGQQDQIIQVKCYHESDFEAETLFQIVRTSLTRKPEFGSFTGAGEAAQQALWSAQGIRRIDVETEGQSLAEPNAGGDRGREFVMGTFRARFKGT